VPRGSTAQMVAIRTASNRRRGVIAAWASTTPRRSSPLCGAAAQGVRRRQRRWAAGCRAGRHPGGRRACPLVCDGLPTVWPGTSRFASPWPRPSPSAVEWWGTPTIALKQDPPVGFLGPIVAGPPTGADALALWDAVVAPAAVPGVLGAVASRPPRPRSQGCACHSSRRRRRRAGRGAPPESGGR
jgi:hypothetical protein